MLARAALPSEPPVAPTTSPSLLQKLAVQDWLVLAYLLVLNVAILRGLKNEHFTHNLVRINLLLAFFLVGIGLTRTNVLRDGWPKAVLYRLAIYAPVQLSYFFFRQILPSVNPGALDKELYAIDVALFGVEPALTFDRFVTPFTTEWFSFFYFGYFLVLAIHVVPVLFLSRHQRLLG